MRKTRGFSPTSTTLGRFFSSCGFYTSGLMCNLSSEKVRLLIKCGFNTRLYAMPRHNNKRDITSVYCHARAPQVECSLRSRQQHWVKPRHIHLCPSTNFEVPNQHFPTLTTREPDLFFFSSCFFFWVTNMYELCFRNLPCMFLFLLFFFSRRAYLQHFNVPTEKKKKLRESCGRQLSNSVVILTHAEILCNWGSLCILSNILCPPSPSSPCHVCFVWEKVCVWWVWSRQRCEVVRKYCTDLKKEWRSHWCVVKVNGFLN